MYGNRSTWQIIRNQTQVTFLHNVVTSRFLDQVFVVGVLLYFFQKLQMQSHCQCLLKKEKLLKEYVAEW